MTISRRMATISLACVASIALLLIGISVLAVQSTWFKNKVRLRIVSIIEKTTGGRAELQDFDYEWRTLSVDMRGFVLHGSEAPSAPPLFKARRIHMQFTIVSFLKKDVDINNLTVDVPEIYLILKSDGNTNLPRPRVPAIRSNIAQQLINLAIQHFELNRGTAEVDNRKYSLDARGNQLQAVVAYASQPSRYSGSLSSRDVLLRSAVAAPLTADIATTFVLANDRLEFPHALIASKGNRVEGAATIDHLAHPKTTFSLNAHLGATEVAHFATFLGASSGALALTGSGTYADQHYSFEGSLDGLDMAYKGSSFALTGITFGSTLTASNNGLFLSKLRAKALGATITGGLSLKHLRSLSLQGRFEGLSVREAGKLFTRRPLVWDGYASGPFTLAGDVKEMSSFELSSTADIVPGSHGIPLGGSVHLFYAAQGNSLRFADSALKLPDSIIGFSGALGDTLNLSLNSTNLQDLPPLLAFVSPAHNALAFPFQLDNGRAHFTGSIDGNLLSPSIKGRLALSRLRYRQFILDTVESNVAFNSHNLTFTGLTLIEGAMHASASGQVALSNWSAEPASRIQLHADIKNANIRTLLTQLAPSKWPWPAGTAGAAVDIAGTIESPSGAASITASGIDTQGEHIDTLSANVKLAGNRLTVDRGEVRSADATLRFRAGYQRASSWRAGHIDLQLDSSRFELANLATIRRIEPGLTGHGQLQAQAAANISAGRIALQSISGGLQLTTLAVDRIPYGDLTLNATTTNGRLKTEFGGNLRDCRFDGSSQIELSGDYRGDGSLKFSPLKFSTTKALVPALQNRNLPFDGLLQGAATFHGPFANPSGIAGSIRIEQFQIDPQLSGINTQATSPHAFTLRNAEPVVIDFVGRTAAIRSLHLTGNDTNLTATGKVALNNSSPFDLNVNGSLNLQVIHLFAPTLQARGITRMNAFITGPLSAPLVAGSIEVQDSSIYSDNFTNGLDHASGLIRFDRNRATIQRLTAQSGGGHVAAGGFVSFGGATPLSYHLQVTADGVRFRYGGLSITSNADLKFSGTNERGLLSGNIIVTKAAFNPNTDVGSLFAASATPLAPPSTENNLLHRIRLEVDVQSASTLELTTSLSQDVQAGIDLRLRGTPDRPIVLGRFSVNQGQIQFFGSRYTINRGEVNFSNPVKIEPVLDLDLQTQARGVTVNIRISGTLDRLNISYRSDPPLQSTEIVALLATGRTPDVTSSVANSQTGNQNNVFAAGANTILGSTVSPASGRLQRFFGITHLKIDPALQGIENVPQARVTLEQQISRQVTITYVTNLSRTSQQIFRFEWALSREYSLVAIRDENGLFGVDLQYKRGFK